MQKFINDPSKVVDEMLEAYSIAHPDLVKTTDNERVIKYKHAPIEGKVGIVTGGGSGHKPAFIGYIGRNMVDAVACGELFSSPPAKMFYDAIKAAKVADRMCNVILPDLPFSSGNEVVVLISGLGSTPLLELYILFRDVQRILTTNGIKIYVTYIGNYFTSLEMAGVTLTLMKLDDELKSCIDYECDSPGMRQFQRL